MQQTSTTELPAGPSSERLDSWKDIAAYLQREVRTVQLWEKNEGLPVHRHAHLKRGTVYAYKSELDAWWRSRSATLTGQGVTLAAAPKSTSRRFVAIGVIAGVFLICAAAWFGMVRRLAQQGAEAAVIPLTSDPGSEMGASFSPDGNQVAFAWRRAGRADFDIYVKVVGSSDALQLTNTPDWDVDPAWSPDGREIAFHRRRPDGWCAIYSVSPLGGSERLIAELTEKNCGCGGWLVSAKLSPAQLSWSPDARWLARPGVFLLFLETGEERKLTSPPNGELDLYPAFSPDGKSLAFVRTVRSGVQVHVIPMAGGESQRITGQTRIFGLAWMPDGRELLYSSSSWEWGEAALWRVSVSGGSPGRVVQGDRAWLPSISRPGGRLAFTRRTSDTNIWRLQADAAGRQQGPAAPLVRSTRDEAAPMFSPDGKRIAFTSDRSGTFQVWICEGDGSNVRQLTFLEGQQTGLGTWSPDGSRIAFNSQANGNYDIYVVGINGEPPRQLTTDTTDEVSPTWSNDGHWVYFASTRTGRHEIYKIPVQGGTVVQVTRNGGQRPVESPDGKFVYYEKGPTFPYEFEPWRVPVDGGDESPVVEGHISRWALVNGGLYFYQLRQDGQSAGTWWLMFYEFATAGKHAVAPLEGMPLLGHRPAVSPDRQTILYAQLDLNDTDLVLVENFR